MSLTPKKHHHFCSLFCLRLSRHFSMEHLFPRLILAGDDVINSELQKGCMTSFSLTPMNQNNQQENFNGWRLLATLLDTEPIKKVVLRIFYLALTIFFFVFVLPPMLYLLSFIIYGFITHQEWIFFEDRFNKLPQIAMATFNVLCMVCALIFRVNGVVEGSE